MIITVGNTKGGVGKSTIACNLAVTGAIEGKRVLLIDADDPQGSSTGFRGLRKKNDIKAMSIPTPTLHKDVKDFMGFDLVIIDAGGKETTVFRSAIMACDLLLLPVLPSQNDLWGTADTIHILREARSYKDLKAFILLNRIIMHTKIAMEAQEALKKIEGDATILKTILYSRVTYIHSIGHGEGVIEYEPGSKAAAEIKALYQELLSILS